MFSAKKASDTLGYYYIDMGIREERECGTWERRTWGRKGMCEEGDVGRKGMRGM